MHDIARRVAELYHKRAGGLDAQDDLLKVLPSMGGMVESYSSWDIVHAAYVFEYIASQTPDRRAKTFAVKLGEAYAHKFSKWLGYAFINRANMVKTSKEATAIEQDLPKWVEAIPAILKGEDNRKISDFLSVASKTILDKTKLDDISKSVINAIRREWTAAGGASGASAKTAGLLEQLSISYDPTQKRYEVAGGRLAFLAKNDLKDLGFRWDAKEKVWWTSVLDGNVLRALPQAAKLEMQGEPPPAKTPVIEVLELDVTNWFFDRWLPSNILRFNKVFDAYGRTGKTPLHFIFSVQGQDVDLSLQANIQNAKEAVELLRFRYGKDPGRLSWLQSFDVFEKLATAKGEGAMHLVDMANNLEHSHGSMMEHYPPGVKEWYPKFLDFKYTAHIQQMVKAIKDSDLRTLCAELMPVTFRMNRLVTPQDAHRTVKGLVLEIMASRLKSGKVKALAEVKKMHPELYPQVVAELKERGAEFV